MDVQGSLSGELEAYGYFRNFPLLLRFFSGVEYLICRLPESIVCSSPASHNFLLSRCAVAAEKVTLLADVVPDTFFQIRDKNIMRQRKGVPQERDVVIYTGSLLVGKGVDILLEAVEEIATIHPEWFFVFLGYPVEWLQKEVKSRGLEQSVLIPGEVSYLQLAEWLAVADIAVDPKKSGSGEASGKILHYMATGLPVVCFELLNNRQLLEENCFYAADISPHGLVQAMELAFINRERWHDIGIKAQTRVADFYSATHAGKILLEIYNI
ncbi:glycosyltransferase family 4 protein [Desulforhopalus vacuolatus]|uniref:glycosyltransferase n=1 Tax=Desulforhopalus vacuolatus TaxID=40414 RepID=UPI00196518A7|nr:glycosyltransferase family 4 protein [Desulforhopalus vacuolatus]